MRVMPPIVRLGLALDAPDSVLETARLRTCLIGAVIGFAFPTAALAALRAQQGRAWSPIRVPA